MESQMLLYVILLAVCLIFSAFFSSAETAFISLQKARLHHEANTNVKGAARVLKLVNKPEKFLSTVLLGNNLVNTAAAALATAIAVRLIPDEDEALIVATIGATIILLIFCETTPKAVAAHHPDSISKIFSRPIEWISWLFTPFVIILSWIAAGVARLTGGKTSPRSLASEEEIRAMITIGETEGAVEESEAEMLHKVFEFTNRPVREVMIPRTDVVFIESGMAIDDFLKIYAETPLSRYPLFKEKRDNVIGMLAIKDVLIALATSSPDRKAKVDDFLRLVYFTPITKPIGELFQEMRDKNLHLCIVVDEFGGTAGVVTLDQLVQEIVGPVGDELAPAEKDFEVIDTHTFEIDGSMRIEEANEEMNLSLPEGDYETVAGLILSLLGRIPRENEQLRYKDLKIVIKQMDGVKIEKILLTKESHAAAPG